MFPSATGLIVFNLIYTNPSSVSQYLLYFSYWCPNSPVNLREDINILNFIIFSYCKENKDDWLLSSLHFETMKIIIQFLSRIKFEKLYNRLFTNTLSYWWASRLVTYCSNIKCTGISMMCKCLCHAFSWNIGEISRAGISGSTEETHNCYIWSRINDWEASVFF